MLSAVGDKKFWKSTMKWIRPLQDEQMTLSNSELIKPVSQAVNTHRFHPFYQSLVERNFTRMKGVSAVRQIYLYLGETFEIYGGWAISALIRAEIAQDNIIWDSSNSVVKANVLPPSWIFLSRGRLRRELSDFYHGWIRWRRVGGTMTLNQIWQPGEGLQATRIIRQGSWTAV